MQKASEDDGFRSTVKNAAIVTQNNIPSKTSFPPFLLALDSGVALGFVAGALFLDS